ncbi:DUF4865 family protein [Streptomyces sp. RB6PN25]|uniref:DUF4865 family protein n=1 Tax=Streptomyces humicola TaxID=2953240 RepID=A0ABT1PYR9_9ACTN|nr:DUF4865 family protein [Streptomyces humicola]MCQ4082828.1 DUF4865 family protein [Streptomyces humicola]
MYTMQYQIALPADYDMGIIRHRVAARGGLTDGFSGLGIKAYLVRDRASGSPVNEYAPFYIWHDVSGMSRFLWGRAGFHGIVSDFGRPAVRHWTGAGFTSGPSVRTTPRAATRRTWRLPADADPAEVVERELGELRLHAIAPGAHSVSLAVDPHRWELVRFTLWEQATAARAEQDGERDGEEDVVRYQVLHLSSPHLDDLLTLDTNVTVTPGLRHK